MRIVLTARVPVEIDSVVWKLIGHADGALGDYGPGMTPRPDHESAAWSMSVREHADGRVIVYAVAERDASEWGRPCPCHDGGEIIEAGADLAAAISRVAIECCVPSKTARNCLASLPAEVL